MTKLTPLSRAAAQAVAVLGACLLGFRLPGARRSAPATKASGENTPLNLKAPAHRLTHTSSSGGASIVRTIVGLAIVIAVIWGLSWILRQVKAGREPHVSSAGPRERRRAHAQHRALRAPGPRRQRLHPARQRRARRRADPPLHRRGGARSRAAAAGRRPGRAAAASSLLAGSAPEGAGQRRAGTRRQSNPASGTQPPRPDAHAHAVPRRRRAAA